MRFNSFFVARVVTCSFTGAWTRERQSARRRYLFLFVLSGRAVVTTPRQTLIVEPEHVGVVAPGSGAVNFDVSVDSKLLFFTFDHDEVAPNHPQEGLVDRRVGDSAVLQTTLVFLQATVQTPSATERTETHVFRGLVRDVARALAAVTTPSIDGADIVDTARVVIGQRYLEHGFSIESLARELASSRPGLERKFAQRGSSVANEIRLRRAMRARSLLQTTNMSLEAVAAASGFRSKAALQRACDRYYQATPGAIRAEQQSSDTMH